MKTYSATEAKNKFGQLLDDAQRGPVRIEKHGRGAVIAMSAEAFEFSQWAQDPKISAAIQEGFDQLDAGRTVDGRTALLQLKNELVNRVAED
ncbi:type II toxin-antitoxin system Phd/YefM family antitoxin [Hyphobacterium sp.]|uniref:type II toxin-antitoxin system Phd/YefM family antitoxin n=1 Tax=Hyphobacterium sp. TaxID=2004662 RepID=UPI003BAD4585